MLNHKVTYLAVLVALAGSATAQSPKVNAPPFLPLHVPYVAIEPHVSGAADDKGEWIDAARATDVFWFGSASRSGTWYSQARLDWTATAASLEDETYPGTTVFIAHDVVGSPDAGNPLHQFQVQADSDWGSFRVPVPGGVAQIWVFAGGNDADDSDWLPFADGLLTESLVPEGVPPDLVNDVGFIARLNDDPATDVHWLPGVAPEPGDPGWDWADWHGVYGRASFGQSFQAAGLDADADDAVDHEVYEIAFHRPDLVVAPVADGDPAAWGQWWDESVGGIAPAWLGAAGSGTPTKPFTPEQALVKTAPIARSEFWLQLRDPLLPAGSPGNPTHDDDLAAVVDQLEELKFTAPFAASVPLTRVQTFFTNAYDLLVAGDTKGAYAKLKIGFKNVKFAEHDGVSKQDLLEPLTNMSVLLFELGAQRVVDVDAAGLASDDAKLRKAYGAMYQVGRRLATASTQGAKAKLKSVATQTRTIFEAAEKAEEALAGP